MGTKIEWTNETWNPVVGCTKVSPGCDNCYAERMAYRLACMGQEKYKGVTTCYDSHNGWNGLVHCDEKALEIPLHWRQPRMIFVCSMSDLFHPSVPFEFIDRVRYAIRDCPQHTFQILTKRPQRMWKYFYGAKPLPNLWLGVTAENQEQADKRIPILLQIPAAVRFVSIEPMLGIINLDALFIKERIGKIPGYFFDCLKGLDQVTVGGESGPGARPMHPDWARGIRDQCQAAGVPFFFKQWGAWLDWDQIDNSVRASDAFARFDNYPDAFRSHILADGTTVYRVTKKIAGRLLDGRTWDELPKLAGKAANSAEPQSTQRIRERKTDCETTAGQARSD